MKTQTKEQMVVKIDWKSEDGYMFTGRAQGHNWDVVQTSSESFRNLEVGDYVHAVRSVNEDWGIHLEEIAFEKLATAREWEQQEKQYKK